MVDVAHNRQLQPDIDYHLDYQFAAWNSLAEYVGRWPEIEDIDREVIQLEWQGITESRLADLRRWDEEGYFTPAQQARLRQLLALVGEMRPALEALFAA
jgi:hypothetical protein